MQSSDNASEGLASLSPSAGESPPPLPDHIEEMLPVGFAELEAIVASPVSGVELLPPPPTDSDSLTSSAATSSLLDDGPLCSTNPSGSTIPDLGQHNDLTTFDLERGFWRVHNGARELLKYANIYQEHKRTMRSSYGDKQCHTAHLIPREIDIESMTQLSWGVMRAVADIGAYDRRIHMLSGRRSRSTTPPVETFRSHDPQRRVSKRQRKDKNTSSRQHHEQQREQDQESTSTGAPMQCNVCKSCGTLQSPQWRYGPEGLLNLCNVCGLLHAKKTQRRKTKLDRERRSNTGAPAGI